ncbi:hypothetical protein CVT26_015882 [Gymnopilus dilepis]|uniref:Uncharacterized protein n=1 Tax=Gymnopilus dilepis TaxID=231916 RepID=A0A409XYD0_9AGAR|nr:hypothetical protein CVT26_015882 [Gymnopilus dilepis]
MLHSNVTNDVNDVQTSTTNVPQKKKPNKIMAKVERCDDVGGGGDHGGIAMPMMMWGDGEDWRSGTTPSSIESGRLTMMMPIIGVSARTAGLLIGGQGGVGLLSSGGGGREEAGDGSESVHGR